MEVQSAVSQHPSVPCVSHIVALGGTRTAEWNNEYSALVVDMQAHLDNIKLRMIEVTMRHDQQNEQSLKTAELVVLASLTELAYAFAQTDMDSRRTAIHLANEMILIIDSFAEGDYPHLDGCVSVSSALDVDYCPTYSRLSLRSMPACMSTKWRLGPRHR